jgi:hypothetical protein
VFNAVCNYEFILGHDVLSDVGGLILDFENNTVEWMGRSIIVKQRGHWDVKDNLFLALTDDHDLDLGDR